MISEETLRTWAKAPGEAEREKMENAETAVRKAIAANARLNKMDISIIRQGSYRSRTNVRQNSDVDLCVCLNSTFFARYPTGKNREDYGNSAGSITFVDFRNLVHRALVDYFGSKEVTAGGKAFDVHSNSYRVDADVVPAFAYRYYAGPGHDDYIEPTGVSFLVGGDGEKIVNWPHQTYENGLAKHDATGKRYKKMVRILKKIRDKMQEDDWEAAKDVGSFQIECLVWNVPDNCFEGESYVDNLRNVIQSAYTSMGDSGNHASLYEVNGLKKLFGAHQPWGREMARAFLEGAWHYAEF